MRSVLSFLLFHMLLVKLIKMRYKCHKSQAVQLTLNTSSNISAEYIYLVSISPKLKYQHEVCYFSLAFPPTSVQDELKRGERFWKFQINRKKVFCKPFFSNQELICLLCFKHKPTNVMCKRNMFENINHADIFIENKPIWNCSIWMWTWQQDIDWPLVCLAVLVRGAFCLLGLSGQGAF